ncbi:MAG: hypothetical protein NVS1B4_23300 [Gemmatimonadaceae bacterium]
MVTRRGGGRLGCLISLLLIAAIAYVGVNIGEPYVRHYRYRDAIAQEAHLAGKNSDVVIRRRLASLADSLGLPEAAQDVAIMRNGRRITITANYVEHVVLPHFARSFPFAVRVESAF